MKLRILALTYKTFPAPLSSVHQATVDALHRMNLKVVAKPAGQKGIARIRASGWSRKLSIELESRDGCGTRARILAKEGFFFEDNVASDLLAQVASLLEHHDRVALPRAAREDAAPSAFVPDQTALPAYAL
jgi:hypothetical protein